jgi:Guanosine polyphosphate pyrophosphohydrolases/synthetases
MLSKDRIMEKQVINFDESIIVKAFNFAKKYHEGQVRKGTDIPYIVHPFNVFTILESMNADTNLLIAGLLHDTLEDTKATKEEILELFNEDVLFLVLNHTEDKNILGMKEKLKQSTN